jgi:hypothetical protein
MLRAPMHGRLLQRLMKGLHRLYEAVMQTRHPVQPLRETAFFQKRFLLRSNLPVQKRNASP